MRTIRVVVREDEEKILPYIWINGNENEVSFEAYLTGEGASLTLVGIFLGSNHSSVVFNTRVVHKAPRTKSLTTIRGVFFDHASFNNDGMVTIRKGSKGANGYFASKVLLFDDAKGRSVPALEIDENDLKAGHAASIGRPDEDQLFYLRSRGLSENEAEKLIVSGFFEPTLAMLAKTDQEGIRKQLLSAL